MNEFFFSLGTHSFFSDGQKGIKFCMDVFQLQRYPIFEKFTESKTYDFFKQLSCECDFHA